MMLPILWLAGMSLCAQTPGLWIEGKWKTKAGDDVAWVRPDFDDSAWEETGPPQLYGWANRRLPEKYGPQWHRATIEIPEAWRKMPLAVSVGGLDDAWELYVEGEHIASFGELPKIASQPPKFLGITVYPDRHQHRAIPLRLTQGANVSIAIRRWVRWAPIRFPQDVARGAASFGHAVRLTPLAAAESEEWVHNFQSAWPNGLRFALVLAALGIGSMLLAMYGMDRARPEYLWLALMFLADGSMGCWSVFVQSAGTRPSSGLDNFALLGIMSAVSTVANVMAVERMVPERYRRVLQTWAAVAGIPPLLSVTGSWFDRGWLPYRIGLTNALYWAGLLLVVLLMLRCHRLGRARDVYLLAAIGARWALARPGRSPQQIDIRGFAVNTAEVSNFVLAVAIAVLLGLEFRERLRQRRAAQQEMEAARRIQQALLASPVVNEGEVRIEATALMAKEVGGDFWQVLPREDGSQIVVVGDVSGKGLDAAMLVSLVVGALHRDESNSPCAILAGLNRVLCAKATGGFVTCCCLRIAPGQSVVAANAGHLAPWLDGVEVPLEPGLPLGVVPGCEYEETSFSMKPGSRLTLVSDGVVEATNARGELFGFERTGALAGKAASEIAEAAQAWGQNDDITVVTLRRNA